MRGFLQNHSTNLNDTNEFDQFIGGYIRSFKLFHISRDERESMDPVMLQRFLQGTNINTLTIYLREHELPDGPSLSLYRCAIDNADDDGVHKHKHVGNKSKKKVKKKSNTSKANTLLKCQI